MSSSSRRTFLRRAGAAVLGVTIWPLSAAGSRGTRVEHPVDFLTPAEEHFVIHGGKDALDDWPGVPSVDAEAWSLRVEGQVETPLDLSLADLRAEGTVTLLKTMRCVVDTDDVPGLVGTALWTGVPLRRVLGRAGVNEGARRVRVFGRDGFANNLRLDAMGSNRADGEVGPILAYRMNGAPIPAEHGFPVRLIVPEAYGFKSVKWLDRINVTASDAPFGQYQKNLGFADDGTIQPLSKATGPTSGATVPAGRVQLTGFALSGIAGVERVDVSVDGGAFEAATITPIDALQEQFPAINEAQQVQESGLRYPYRGVWALWTHTVDLPPGEHVLRLRATDRSGVTQPPTDEDESDGSTAIPEVRVTAE
jgi:DMSO/TMAO reductase YedYZ molybdopterin-dependent catalytic subunit